MAFVTPPLCSVVPAAPTRRLTLREHRNHVIATVEIALNARAADGSRLYDTSTHDLSVAATHQLLAHFQSTGEFRADFDPLIMAKAIRAAIDDVAAQIARNPELDVDHYARELADLFDVATRLEET